MEWNSLYMKKVEHTEKIVYYWYNPKNPTSIRMLFVALTALFIIYIYLKKYECLFQNNTMRIQSNQALLLPFPLHSK